MSQSCKNIPFECENQKALQHVWVVVNTLPNREDYALQNLERQGFDTYCPMVRKRVKHARTVSEVLRPLFPCYLFVRVSRNLLSWRPILSTLGVRTLVRCGDQPSFVGEGLILALKSREYEGAIVPAPHTYRLGQQVRMKDTVFEGFVATIVEMDEKDRLVVLMDMLNRPVKLKVESRSITAV